MKQPGKIKYLHNLMTSRQMSCREITEKYLEAISRDNAQLNAFINITCDKALSAAQNTDIKLNSRQGLAPLEGIPMSLKDNMSTAGIETTCCSSMLKGYNPIYDCTVWNILKSQNAVLLGKTNMDEFAMGSSCETSIFGGALNPHDISRVAGGSSGGAAAAVAANLAVYGLGSDTGGSIRQPASFCGLVGLKPTYGAVSRYGLIAYASEFDQIGPLTRTVEDAAAVYDSIAIRDKMDSTSQGKEEAVSPLLGQSIKGMKIGIIGECFRNIDYGVQSAIEKAAETLKHSGAEIVSISIPELSYALPVYYILACAQASSNLGRYDGIRYGYRTNRYSTIDEMVCKTRSEGFGPEVRRRILLGTYVLSSGYYVAYYKKAQQLRGVISEAFDRAFEKCNIMLTPTVPRTAFEKGCACADPVETYMMDICTVPASITGLPALSMPCGFHKDGLPIGMQFIGEKYGEGDIMRAAFIYEEAQEHYIYKKIDMGVAL